jgi:hypothetical protein
MKTIKIGLALAGLIIIIGFQTSRAIDFSKPITINSEIGDTLDRFERDRYGLFEEADGFQSAVFAMSDDSTLYAKVLTEKGGKTDSYVVDCGYAEDYMEKHSLSKSYRRPPWENSFYIAFGGGKPLGQKYELGLNIAGHVSPSLIMRANDSWSNGGCAALGLRIIGPFLMLHFAPYFSLETGSSLSLFGESDKYHSYSAGLAITTTRWLQIRSEIGKGHTSKYISGGRCFFGSSTPVVREDKNQTFFNFSLEIDLNGIF